MIELSKNHSFNKFIEGTKINEIENRLVQIPDQIGEYKRKATYENDHFNEIDLLYIEEEDLLKKEGEAIEAIEAYGKDLADDVLPDLEDFEEGMSESLIILDLLKNNDFLEKNFEKLGIPKEIINLPNIELIDDYSDIFAYTRIKPQRDEENYYARTPDNDNHIMFKPDLVMNFIDYQINNLYFIANNKEQYDSIEKGFYSYSDFIELEDTNQLFRPTDISYIIFGKNGNDFLQKLADTDPKYTEIISYIMFSIAIRDESLLFQDGKFSDFNDVISSFLSNTRLKRYDDDEKWEETDINTLDAFKEIYENRNYYDDDDIYNLLNNAIEKMIEQKNKTSQNNEIEMMISETIEKMANDEDVQGKDQNTNNKKTGNISVSLVLLLASIISIGLIIMEVLFK